VAIGELDEDEFEIELKAIKQVQKTNVLANPKLTILNRQSAKISIGDRVPYVITTTTGTGDNISVSEDN
jgi:type II secretory pathway component GspD/PulD (secretin)